MPGKNSNYDGSRHNWLMRNIAPHAWIYVMVATVSLELWGMIRFYYWREETRYSSGSAFLTLFYLFFDSMVFHTLWVSNGSDPGYLFPKEKDEEEMVAIT